MIWFLEFRERDVGGPVVPGQVAFPTGISDPSATRDALSVQQHITFLIHGFNVNRASGRAALHAFAAELSRTPPLLPPGAALVAVTWPGDSWAGPLGYPLEGNDADDTAAALADFIETWIPPGARFDFITHSMGARVAFETLKRLPRGAYVIGEVCAMAPAVDDVSVSEPPAYRAQVKDASRVAVLASRADTVLRLAYPIGDLAQAFLFFWKDVSGLALGYHGPRPGRFAPVPPNVVSVQIPTADGVGHSDYLFTGAPNNKQSRAVRFAGDALAGAASPRY
ncbi:MAG: alpha/beta hydrolase [Gemmatimonadaceae bacterium]|nr:alpha/beta hydrolase [Gemmatimonadaceae bacterium]